MPMIWLGHGVHHLGRVLISDSSCPATVDLSLHRIGGAAGDEHHGGCEVLGTMLLGSIAQQVLRQARMPVLLLRPEPAARSRRPRPRASRPCSCPWMKPQRRRRRCRSQPAWRSQWARARLLLVVPTVGTLRDERAVAARIFPLATAEVLALEEENAAAYVQNVAARMRQQGVAVSAEVARGNAVDVLVVAAKDVDLVVMASHGRSGLAALWSASIGSGVQARAETPLLLCNPRRRGLTPSPQDS